MPQRWEPLPLCAFVLSAEIAHYRQVLTTLRELQIEPWATLHHFTLPVWFARRRGFSQVAQTLSR
jgi:beta-glucosidase